MNDPVKVFVSSTYKNLIKERLSVAESLTEAGCAVLNMETFPASSRPPWDVIQRKIDLCDVFVLIIAGNYGSIIPEDGISYTEKEYNYAHAEGKPILVFFHESPSRLPDVDTGADWQRLEAFKKLALQDKTGKSWRDGQQLGQIVPASVLSEMNQVEEQVNTDHVRFRRFLDPKANKPVSIGVGLTNSLGFSPAFVFPSTPKDEPSLDQGEFIATYSAIWRGIYKKLILNLSKQLIDNGDNDSLLILSLMTFIDETIDRHCKGVTLSPFSGHSISHASNDHDSIIKQFQDWELLDGRKMITATGIKYGKYLDHIFYLDASIKCPFQKYT